MNTPKPNEENRVEVMHALIRAHPLGTWTLLAQGDPLTQHVPFQLDADRGPFGTLVGHAARAVPAFTDDRDRLLAHVAHRTDAHEAAESAPSAVARWVRRGDEASAGSVSRST